MITIKKPFIEHEGEYASLKCEIIIQDPTSENARGGVIFFKVKNEYAPYLTYERSDAYIYRTIKICHVQQARYPMRNACFRNSAIQS